MAKVVDTKEYLDMICQLLREGHGQVPVTVAGSSMTPFLVHGRDTVLLSKIRRPLKKGDVILYFSFSGAVRELTEVGKILQGTEAKLILVTRFPNSPGAQYADLLLICGANEAPRQQGSIAAKIGQLFIVDVLFHEFCARNGIYNVFSSGEEI